MEVRMSRAAFVPLSLVLLLAWTVSANPAYTCSTVRLTSGKATSRSYTGVYTSLSPTARVDAVLRRASPSDACRTVQPQNSSWVALVDFCGNDLCSTETKISNAAAAGAMGVILANCELTKDIPLLVTMKFSSTPSVSVSGNTGSILKDLLVNLDDTYRATIEPDLSCDQQRVMSPTWLLYTGVVLLIICIGSLLAVAFYFIYRRRYMRARRVRIVVQKRPSPALIDAVRRIPTITIGEDASHTARYGTDTCAVCLEEYENGQVASVLECGHIFHSACVTTWLVSHGTCPLCKAEVMRSLLGDADMWTTVLESAGGNGNAEPTAAQAVAVLHEAGLLHIDMPTRTTRGTTSQSAVVETMSPSIIAAVVASNAQGSTTVEMVDLSPEARRRRGNDEQPRTPPGNAWTTTSELTSVHTHVSPRMSAVSDVSDANFPRASMVGITDDDDDIDVEIIGEVRVVPN